MIKDLLEYSRTGHTEEMKQTADFNIILSDVQQNLLKLIADNNAKIIIKKDLPIIPVYKAEISRLFQNLLSNAIKFRKKDVAPVIFINSEKLSNEWLFSIEDNGIGIGKDNFDKVFEIFSRLNSKTVYDGTGIGLAICKKIIELHHGKIWF